MQSEPQLAYPWTDKDPQATVLRSSQARGSGIAHAFASASPEAKTLLKQLQLSEPTPQMSTHHLHTSVFFRSSTTSKRLLGLILDQFSVAAAETTELSARRIIKECALHIDPEATPGNMDAKEVILAALHFLCSQGILEVASPADNLEKRSFRLVHQPSNLGQLQLLWDISPIRRDKFVPPFLMEADELLLTTRGILPASARPPKAPVTPKRKGTPTPTPEPAAKKLKV